MQPQLQKTVARVYRIEGSIVLHRSAAKTPFKTEPSLLRAEPWWSTVVGVPLLFLRTLLRLVFVCAHWHLGPPITPRDPMPFNLAGFRSAYGRGTYVTCLDCGQKFVYSCETRRLGNFWGIHDPEALAEIHWRISRFFSPLRGFAASRGRVNIAIPMEDLVRSVHHLGILTKGH